MAFGGSAFLSIESFLAASITIAFWSGWIEYSTPPSSCSSSSKFNRFVKVGAEAERPLCDSRSVNFRDDLSVASTGQTLLPDLLARKGHASLNLCK